MTQQSRIDKGMWWDRALTLTKGCTPAGLGCAHCWSAAQSHIRSKQRNPPPCYVGVTDEHGKWNGVVEPLPAALEVPLHVRKPTTWAVWNDLLHEDIPLWFVEEAIYVIDKCQQHTFVVLTKRHERLDLLSKFNLPRNMIVGYSASTQRELDAGLDDLRQTPAACLALSLEPLLEPIDVPLDGIGWVIAGAESGHNRRPCDTKWLESIAYHCGDAHVPCFVKQGHVDGRVVPLPLGHLWAQVPEVSR